MSVRKEISHSKVSTLLCVNMNTYSLRLLMFKLVQPRLNYVLSKHLSMANMYELNFADEDPD